MADFMPGFDLPKAAAPAKIQIEKPPVWGAAKGLPGLAASSPWTQAQRTAGMRREIPLGQVGGLGTNRVAPPPPPQIIYQPGRGDLASMLNGARGGGYDMNPFNGGNGSAGGYTTSGVNQQGHSWGYTPSGVRSSAGWGGGRGSGWGSASEGGMGGKGSFF